MWDSEVWTGYVDQYSREMYLAQDALLSHPCGSPFKHDSKGNIIWEGGKPVLSDEHDEEHTKLCVAYDNAAAAWNNAKRYRDAMFPDRCAERGIFARLQEPQRAFMGKNREPLTKAYLTQFGTDIKSGKQRGLIFCGNVGTGKTYIAAGIAQRLCFSSVSCRYILMPELLERIHKAVSYKSGKSVHSVICDTLDSTFVVLDEVGRSLTAGNTGALFEIFDILWNGKYSYIVISNKSVEDFMSNIDSACLDRLNGTFVSFEGESWRGEETGAHSARSGAYLEEAA